MLQVSNLVSNFQESYSASFNETTEEITLIASPFFSSVYDASVGWGRMWTWIYWVLSAVIPEGYQERRLETVLRETNELFQQTLPAIQEAARRFNESLKNCTEPVEVSDEPFQHAKQELEKWEWSLGPFFRAYLKKENQKFSDFVNRTFTLPDDLSEIATAFDCQSIIDFGRSMDTPLPIRLFLHSAKKHPLTQDQEDRFIKYLRLIELKCEENSSYVTKFYDVLKRIARFASKQDEDVSWETFLMNMEQEIHRRNAHLFTHPDPEYLDWRAQLQPGSQLFSNGKLYVLGAPINNSNNGVDNVATFAIKGEPNSVLRIGQNSSLLRLLFPEVEQEENPLIELAKTFAWDAERGFLVVEKLEAPLIESDIDLKKNFIRKFFKKLDKENRSIWGVKAENLFFNNEGDLRSTEPVRSKKGLLWTHIEEFFYDFSSEDSELFKYAMDTVVLPRMKRGVNGHSCGWYGFFWRITYKAALNEEIDVEEEMNEIRGEHENMLDSARELYKNIKALRARLETRFRAQFSGDDSAFNKDLANKICAAFKKTYCITRFRPCVEEHVNASYEPLLRSLNQ